MNDFFAKLAEIQKSGRFASFCLITQTKGSSPRKAGAKMIVTDDGEIFGTVGGGNIEMTVIEEAKKICRQSSPVKLVLNLEDDATMKCGGTVEVYIEPVAPLHDLVLFGAGHARRPHRYLGMIGSTRKVAAARKHYLDNNILTEQEINEIDMPIGIKFNAQTPEEIAISIVARLIDVKNSPS